MKNYPSNLLNLRATWLWEFYEINKEGLFNFLADQTNVVAFYWTPSVCFHEKENSLEFREIASTLLVWTANQFLSHSSVKEHKRKVVFRILMGDTDPLLSDCHYSFKAKHHTGTSRGLMLKFRNFIIYSKLTHSQI